MVVFNKATLVQESIAYVNDVIHSRKISGDGKYTKLCSEWMENRFCAKKVLMTTSCTAALEMAAILLDISKGDEVIMPSYTFVSTANAFVIRGGVPVFIDVRPDTMNIDENLIENAITEKTKAICVVHYAGIGCDMDKIMEISHRYNIPVIEDAAQGVMAFYNERALGTFGDFGCYSFHETKNYTMGEGGALLINNPKYVDRAEILREKGTNRSRYYRGEIDKYSWVDIGSSYLPSEINAAYLYGQLEIADKINVDRLYSWHYYEEKLKTLCDDGTIECPVIPSKCTHNAHIFWIKFKDLDERTKFLRFVRKYNIECFFHYVPLHSSLGGIRYGRFNGRDRYTTVESERLVRLPMYYGLSDDDKDEVIKSIKDFWG